MAGVVVVEATPEPLSGTAAPRAVEQLATVVLVHE